MPSALTGGTNGSWTSRGEILTWASLYFLERFERIWQKLHNFIFWSLFSNFQKQTDFRICLYMNIIFTWCIIQGSLGARDRKPTPTSWNGRGVLGAQRPSDGPWQEASGSPACLPAATKVRRRVSSSPTSATRHRCPGLDSPPRSSLSGRERLPSCAHLSAAPGGRITPGGGGSPGGTTAPKHGKVPLPEDRRGWAGNSKCLLQIGFHPKGRNTLSGNFWLKLGEWKKTPREEIRERRHTE